MVEKMNISLLYGIIAKMVKKKINPSYTELSRKWSKAFIYKGIFDFAIVPLFAGVAILLSAKGNDLWFGTKISTALCSFNVHTHCTRSCSQPMFFEFQFFFEAKRNKRCGYSVLLV